MALTLNGQLQVYPLGEGTPLTVPGFTPGDTVVRWSNDGRFIFLWRRDAGAPARMFRLEVASGRREPWIELRPPEPSGIYTYTALVLTANGNSYAYTYGRTLSRLYLVDGLR